MWCKDLEPCREAQVQDYPVLYPIITSREQTSHAAFTFYFTDKNPDNVEECTQRFNTIRQAYEVLSDPQERAWWVMWLRCVYVLSKLTEKKLGKYSVIDYWACFICLYMYCFLLLVALPSSSPRKPPCVLTICTCHCTYLMYPYAWWYFSPLRQATYKTNVFNYDCIKSTPNLRSMF